jgi:hypothetical protein
MRLYFFYFAPISSTGRKRNLKMKSTIIFPILMFPILFFGQITNHFNNLDSKWNVAKTYPAANQQNPGFVATTTIVYGFQGDTLINNEKWFKLYSTNDSLFQNNLVYQGLTRTENNRILHLDILNQLDTLYDFNLNMGDSILFYLYGLYPEWLQVINVDDIQLNGITYKRIKFSEPSITGFDELNEVWIEGIGSIHGPLFSKFPIKFSQEMPDSMLLTCTYSDNQYIWQHPSYSNCYVNIVLGLKTKGIPNFKIYPNPFSDKINIENMENENYDLTIFNKLGQTVRQMQIISNNVIIDLSGLNDGVYFLRLNNKRNAKTVKMIKKR